MASNTALSSGYDYQFVVQVPEDYICSICYLTMRKPVQTRCGHRFCKDCLDAALKRQPKCPLDKESLTSQQIFEDVATERQILSLKIKCPNDCDWQGEMRDLKDHVEKCLLTIVPCSYISIGCNFKGPRRSLSDHYKNNLADHLTITTQQLLTLRGEVLELKASSIALMTKDDQSHYSYTWKINDFSKQLYSLQSSKTVTSNCTANRSTLTSMDTN
ncbi:TNF receptor-associated factor 6 [Exaiptasia diaphana]|uniref:TNF receptor-associated factor 6 n=1 Tax=Exaiptasia diaphana TaxID=2652724 RepID=A0A913YC35_EXADI|nr:TNF receptor-associated factor 6 [Exaiptasia diaphana]